MVLLFVFAITLLGAVLLSELADRSVLSAAVLFLVVGMVAGSHLLNLEPTDAVLSSSW